MCRHTFSFFSESKNFRIKFLVFDDLFYFLILKTKTKNIKVTVFGKSIKPNKN